MKVCNKCKQERSGKLFRVRKNRSGNLYRISVCLYCEREQKNLAEKARYACFSTEEKKKHHERAREYQKTEKYRIWHRKWQKDRELSDRCFLIKRRVGALLRNSVKFDIKAGNGIFDILGYTSRDFINHIEGQFESWMNWGNWGVYRPDSWNDNDSGTWTWQIDHIIPQSKLPFDSVEHSNFKKCWGLENLRPLSSKENVLKGNLCIIGH